MLVLTRKVGQKLFIGDNIAVVVNRVAGNRVSLAFEAPEDVQIMRGEVREIRQQFHDEPEGKSGKTPGIVRFEQDVEVTATG